MSAYGFPDGQEITQWLGQPIDEQSGYAIGAGSKVIGPAVLANFASIIVSLKPTGGPVTVTVDQTINGGPAGLKLSQQVVVAAGATLFEAFVLFADQVTVTLQGSIGGTTVDYAVYPSNTTTNAQVITQATINVQHNGVLVAAEPTIDFEDATGFAWTVADDAPNTRVKITPPVPGLTLIEDKLLVAAGNFDFVGIPQTFKHLMLVWEGADTTAGNIEEVLGLRFDGDAGGNYSQQSTTGRNAAVSAFASSGDTSTRIGVYPTTNGGLSVGSGKVIIPNYTSTVFPHVTNWEAFCFASGLTFRADAGGGLWNSNAAINRVTFAPAASFIIGSRATLWGMG